MTESFAFLDFADAAPELRLKLQTFLRDVFASIDCMRADLALEAERSNLKIDKVSRDGEERIDRWLRQVLIDIGFGSQGAYGQIVLMRLVYVCMATSIGSTIRRGQQRTVTFSRRRSPEPLSPLPIVNPPTEDSVPSIVQEKPAPCERP